MIKNILFTLSLLVVCSFCSAQKYSNLQADFSIIEKNTLKDSSFIVVGSIHFDLFENKSIYEINFPYKSSWVFQDSTVSKYDSLMVLQSIDTIGPHFNEFSVFSKILKGNLLDFGLEQAGFVIDEVDKVDSSIIYKWVPPTGQFQFINYVVTQQDDERLSGLIIVDENDKSINKTYYQDYQVIHNIDVPQMIKLHFIAQEEEILKVIKLRDVQIY